jgi:hypothetical protein
MHILFSSDLCQISSFRTLDVVLHPNQKEGLIHLPTPRTHGWVGRDGWNLGCIFGEIGVSFCTPFPCFTCTKLQMLTPDVRQTFSFVQGTMKSEK